MFGMGTKLTAPSGKEIVRPHEQKIHLKAEEADMGSVYSKADERQVG